MKKRLLKTTAYCLIGTLAFSGYPVKSLAAEFSLSRENAIQKYYVDASVGKLNTESTPTKEEEWSNLAISKVSDYINIRKEASEESNILGKLYANSAATVIKSGVDWSKIKSGTVTGYVKTEFLAVGKEAKELVPKVGKRIATVNTMTLKVRKEPDADARVESLIPIEEKLDVVEETEGWIKVSIDSDILGYVSSDYVTISTELKKAESIEEEKARLALEKEQASKAQTDNSSKSKNSSVEAATGSKRNSIVNYALQFVGNPYVWGGTSLTKGADCSGFTQSVFRDNNISIPRDSRTQASSGKEVSIQNIQPGDLIFYTNSQTINHVALYIGNGKVIGASNPESGIKISNYNYRQPHKVVSYIS